MTLVKEALLHACMPNVARPVPPPLKAGDTLLLERQDYYGSPFGDNDPRAIDDAVRIGGVSQLTGLDQLDAYQLIAQAGDVTIGNVCDSLNTVPAVIGTRYLAGAEAYGGAHERLRDLADTLWGMP